MERINLLKTLHRLGVIEIDILMRHIGSYGNPEGTNGFTWCGWYSGDNYYVSFKNGNIRRN